MIAVLRASTARTRVASDGIARVEMREGVMARERRGPIGRRPAWLLYGRQREPLGDGRVHRGVGLHIPNLYLPAPTGEAAQERGYARINRIACGGHLAMLDACPRGEQPQSRIAGRDAGTGAAVDN